MGKLGVTEIVMIVVGIPISLLIYFIPAIIANRRKAVHRAGIVIVNFLVGWTGLGWLGALIWALLNRTDGEVYNVATGSTARSFDQRAEQLLKLKQLLDAGALTEDEYSREKAKLLG